MYGWLVKQVSRAVATRVAQGDASLLNRFTAERVRFRFPGQHPFAADVSTRAEVEQWWARFAHFRPKFEIHDAIASGPPWNIRACLYFTDQIGDPADGTPYVNEGVCLFRIRWWKVVEERVFLDTQAVAEFFGTETAEEFFPETMPGQP
jgi:ketosteroid isomerase-like protein